jgi:hypothetical protein
VLQREQFQLSNHGPAQVTPFGLTDPGTSDFLGVAAFEETQTGVRVEDLLKDMTHLGSYSLRPYTTMILLSSIKTSAGA